MPLQKSQVRVEFEHGRRQSAFFSFLAATMAGIIATDTWVSPALGIPGGLLAGGAAYALVYGYETLMWRRHGGH